MQGDDGFHQRSEDAEQLILAISRRLLDFKGFTSLMLRANALHPKPRAKFITPSDTVFPLDPPCNDVKRAFLFGAFVTVKSISSLAVSRLNPSKSLVPPGFSRLFLLPPTFCRQIRSFPGSHLFSPVFIQFVPDSSILRKMKLFAGARGKSRA
jgi:hypothetical protein